MELLLLHGKPGNKIRRLPADRLRGDGMYDYDANTVVQRTLDMLFHCNYNSIYGFAAESFATVNAEFEKRPKLHPKLAELKDAISATHTHDDTLPPASIDPIRARFSAGAPKDSLLR